VGWSPQHIAGRGPLAVSTSTIYREAYGSQQQVWPRLLRGVPRSETRRRQKRERIHDRVMIDQRPPEVETREQVGHLEGDTMRSPDGFGATPLRHPVGVERSEYLT
jgi:IS30 family transposase